MNPNLKQEEVSCDFCVVGGGLAGAFAALSAARHGAKVILIQDRPMLGGNASSEIRMWPRGARGAFNAESGLMGELRERNIRYNPTLLATSFDAVLYDMVTEHPNVKVYFNCSCADAMVQGGRIVSVTAWQLTTYTWVTVRAALFADCSGDSILAPLTGADCTIGREASATWGETLAHETADSKTMGLSVLLAARETDHPVAFIPPPFAHRYETDEDFSCGAGGVHILTRDHDIRSGEQNLWWVELGGDMDSLHDADRVREELLRCIYGVWDHMKNHGEHEMSNWELEWVGFLPGKRETGRYVGDIVVCESDLTSGGRFFDEVAYGGWDMDDHDPAGMRRGVAASHSVPVPEPYGLPYRAMYSRNIENLYFAGRNISVTHIALSSTRVMGTCSVIGQAVGTAAAIAVKTGLTPREVGKQKIDLLQQTLLRDGVWLPHIAYRVSEATRAASLGLSEDAVSVLLNGTERPRTVNGENGVCLHAGDTLHIRLDKARKVTTLRLNLDPDWGQTTVSDNNLLQDYPYKIHSPRSLQPVAVAAPIIRALHIEADGETVYRTDDNFRSLLLIPVVREVTELDISFEKTHGAESFYLFGLDIL